MAEPLPLAATSSDSLLWSGADYQSKSKAVLAPDNPSSDYAAMFPYWEMVEAIIGGTFSMRNQGRKFLPQLPAEVLKDYNHRLNNAVFTNIYADIVSNLASKPFAEELQLEEGSPDQFVNLADDIDGRGNNLHVFASELFYWGINHAIDWILVDYPKAKLPSNGAPLTRYDEAQQGLRPYWVHIRAPRMIAVYSDCVNSQELFVHARISECTVQRQGFGEVYIERIREFNREPIVNEFGRVVSYSPATYKLWEKQAKSDRRGAGSMWTVVEEGPISIGIIPIIPFYTGKRIESSWQFIPVMRDCAHAQIEHYQNETNLKSIKEVAAFPMLTGDGVTAPQGKDNQIKVGARAVLYAPPIGDAGQHGSWKYIEPAGTSLKFLADEIDRLEKQMRELGRQPLTAQSGNLTVVTTAFAAQKGNSAVQQWALNLKDALEQAMYVTARWLGQEDGPDVRVFTDFAIEMGDDKSQTWIIDMAKRNRLSAKTEYEEARRRNVLSADFDPDEEEKRLAAEEPPEPTMEDLSNAISMGAKPPSLPAMKRFPVSKKKLPPK